MLRFESRQGRHIGRNVSAIRKDSSTVHRNGQIAFYNFFNSYLFLSWYSSSRRHTLFSRDWTSDVCSSDLEPSCTWFFYQYNVPDGTGVRLHLGRHVGKTIE